MVVGIDGSEEALAAVRWAAAIAAGRHRRLVLVHVVDDLLGYHRALPLRENMHEAMRERGHRLLGHARDAAREVAPDVEIATRLRWDTVPAVLLGEAASAALLVLGTPQLRPLGRILVGSVTTALAAHAPCPVAVVRTHTGEQAPPATGPVVVGVDGSAASEHAVELAFQEASWRGAPLVALHTWNDEFLAAVFAETGWELDRPEVEEHERELLAQRLAGWQEKYPDVTVHRLVTRGRPADRLLEQAESAQLLVVGSRGRGGFTGMVLGSTSQAVMAHARCPVIVARRGEPD
ncbi:universal stress protein [Amycolatopsis suaedae]|uniref:Universal stress protein n=1 Tax=Amycolatopsis suaedae TaxID=2510978 RepID=A0A4Q7JGD3_9PSEU|nr:universal stress protein [Amycolatopsis suaedae]